MINGVRKDLEGVSSILFQSTIPTFAWIYWANPRTHQSG